MNVLNPFRRSLADWHMLLGIAFAIIDYGMLVDLAPSLPKIGLILSLILRDFQPRIFCGYFLIAALFNGYLLSFILGSIMNAQLVAKYVYGIDLRDVCSGNIGWSNFARIDAHKIAVLLVGIAELGKGALAVHYQGSYGLIWALLGHIFCPWTGTGGGKGVAVYLGSALYQYPFIGMISIALKLLLHKYKYNATESSVITVALVALLSMNMMFIIGATVIILMHNTTSEITQSTPLMKDHDEPDLYLTENAGVIMGDIRMYLAAKMNNVIDLIRNLYKR
jgi:glycerol-3-phosphate acyltransferase PlsY